LIWPANKGSQLAAYIVRRVVQAVVVLWVIWTLLFVIYFVVPHDPARLLLGFRAPEEAVQKLRVALGLERPVWDQYLQYFSRIFHGDLGTSFVRAVGRPGAPVSSIVAADVPVDVELALPAAALWLLIGVGIGALSAWRPGSLRARSATIFIFSIVSTPTFVLGGLAIFISENLLTANGIRLFADAYTWVPLHVDPLSWADHLILPWLTLAPVNSAVYARLSRSSLSEVLAEDYIRTARAKGVSERRVLFRHALRAAMTPLMTQFGIDLGAVLAGAVVVEVVFGLPGLGLQLITAVQSEDLPTIQGIALFISGVVVTANLIVDLLYGLVDPRVRLGAARG